jgi:hypothetical protein
MLGGHLLAGVLLARRDDDLRAVLGQRSAMARPMPRELNR